ncbi:MAG: 50S ribosomal protein L30 [Bacteroidales bacterium]|nr:50S ribosomal protein L30 [Bacteroidales bacterium]MBQ2488872.1 50S ribosomal protein L30 [Bacteroidales bacterium]MBR5664692.1 50S ribosomal protein L30 [Bacteroidales bacterium]MCR5190826.1 50S ribosomal protein L30 [Bacteroidales bacterium]
MMKKLKVTQVRSIIGRPKVQKLTMAALGIKKMHHSVEVEATPQVLGMIDVVKHLVAVEEI